MYYYILYSVLSIIVLPAIIFGIYAQAKVNKAYNNAMTMPNSKNITASTFARQVLNAAGLENVKVVEVAGKLNDHYDPKNKVVAISSGNYNSTSLAALGITAHEIGHALQDKTGYKPLKIRHFFVNITNFFSKALFPLLLLSAVISFFLAFFWGFGYNFNSLSYIPLFIVIGLYGLSCLLSLVTLFVEYNASARTEELLVDTDLLNEDEYYEVKKVLKAAALTYVAAFVTNLLELLRLVLLFLTIRNRDNK